MTSERPIYLLAPNKEQANIARQRLGLSPAEVRDLSSTPLGRGHLARPEQIVECPGFWRHPRAAEIEFDLRCGFQKLGMSRDAPFALLNDEDRVTRSIKGCARCRGAGHDDLVFEKLEYPVVDADGRLDTYWAPCPTNGQPILLRFREILEMP